ncbi:MAG: glycosyltransferase [Thiohalocapsa sp. PB-PSB1]|jgi:glycosyltransferase involved in cell wall biosynthesis|nr:MAG: glycosyltransferase [Thiohalocapsa sp. PB-PSB1]HCS88794.1 glycosyl transferase [Chromatiaceae bacterium]
MPNNARPVLLFASFSGAGGVERMLVNLMRGLVELGHPVDLLLAGNDSPHLARLPAAVRRIDLGTRHTLAAAVGLARYLRRERPPALLVAKDRAGRAAVIARRLAGSNTRIVLRLGTNLSAAMAGRSALDRWLRYLPIRRLYPAIDHIVAVSDGVAADVMAIARYPRARISVIRNPVITPELIRDASLPCPHAWLHAPREPHLPVIVGAGRLQRQKDFPTLIRAFALLRRRRRCRLLVLGDGGDRTALQALIERLGMQQDVDLPGFQHNLSCFLARADLFVLSSAWEGSPNVLTEAMALGTPVVATDCPSGPREILAEGRFGPLVPVGDEHRLAAAMAHMLDRPTAPATLKSAVSEYAYRSSAARYLDLLRDRR